MSNSGSLGSTSRPLGADAGVSVSGALGGSVGGLPSATGGGGGGSSKGYGSFTNLDTASNSAPGSAKVCRIVVVVVVVFLVVVVIVVDDD